MPTIKGAPDGAQRSGSVGERRSGGASELLPLGGSEGYAARDDAHALLSASSSERWLHCPPSARLGEQFPDTGSAYAAAGTLAHAIAELKARKYFLEPMSTRTYNARMKKLKEDPSYDKGMDASTDEYLDYLKALAMRFGAAQPFVALETRVDFSDYAPEGFGTADCIMIGDRRLCVNDYKNGSGVPVEAENNSQMMLYALGALKLYAPIYGDTIREIHLAIIQPNAGGVKEWSCTRAELEAWGLSYVQPRAALAYAGGGEFDPGAWCRFCPAAARCSARAAKMLELEPMKGAVPEGAPPEGRATVAPLLTDAQVGEVLSRALDLEAWVKDLKDYALTAALEGRKITGFKAVEGRGSRDWTDLDAALQILQERGVAEAMLYERRPVTPPALERALGKGPFAEIAGDLVTKKPGKPALAPESDKRPPYNAAQLAFGD